MNRYIDEPNENDVRPDRPIAIARHASNVNQDNSVNKHLPYIWFNGVIAAMALGLSVGLMFFVLFAYDRASVSENHWRNIEVDVKELQRAQPK